MNTIATYRCIYITSVKRLSKAIPCQQLVNNQYKRSFSNIKAVNVDQIKSLKNDLKQWIPDQNNAPILVRLAWHDSATFDKNSKEGWPKHGGADASIRFQPELNHDGNAGLKGVVDKLAQWIDKYPEVSYADLYQLASACAIEVAGGPAIPLRFGRLDCPKPEDCPEEGRLPGSGRPPYSTAQNPSEHLRNVFSRMGLEDKDICALSGAHTLGRAYKDRSGTTDRDSTKYTKDVKPGMTPGGQSWTKEWLKFDNSYFKEIQAQNDKDLIVLQTDDALSADQEFRKYVQLYAQDQSAFFKDYAPAQAKLSELGSKWENDKPTEVTF